MSHGSAAIPANERVRRAGGQTQDKSDEVPGNSAEQSCEKNLLRDDFDMDHAFADSAGDGGAKDESGNKVPEGGPRYGAERCEYASGDDGGDRVGGDRKSTRLNSSHGYIS